MNGRINRALTHRPVPSSTFNGASGSEPAALHGWTRLASAGQQRSCRSGQRTRDLARFLDLRGLAPTGLRALAGLTVSGRPAPTGVTDGPPSGRKWARHPGLSWDWFLIMQT